jgi:hypothetical protein
LKETRHDGSNNGWRDDVGHGPIGLLVITVLLLAATALVRLLPSLSRATPSAASEHVSEFRAMSPAAGEFLSGCAPEEVHGMSREMQILLGAKIMGQVSGYHPIKTLDPDFLLPVMR